MPLPFVDPSTKLPGSGGITIGDFWRWAYSDVLSNRNRSIFAEFLVGSALDCIDTQPRLEWASCDLHYAGKPIEVKSSAYLQSWKQTKPSVIRFSIAPARFWNQSTHQYEEGPRRSAHLYVFCLFTPTNPAGANVLDTAQWEFYTILTAALNQHFPAARSLSLTSLRRIASPCSYERLREVVNSLLAGPRPPSFPARS